MRDSSEWSSRLRRALALLMSAAGCTPDTHLFDEGRAVSADAGVDVGESTLPPVLHHVSVTAGAGCLRLRVESSKAVTATAVLRAGSDVLERPLGNGASLFDEAFLATGLPAGEMGSATVRVIDGAGREAEGGPAEFRVPPPPAMPLVITEVLPNPAGSESTQEYVEILNRGAAAVALGGLFLEDDAGRDPLPAAELPPGARALLVPAGFDPAGGLDVAPRPDAVLLRLPGRLGRDGLRQAGEVVRLVTAEGNLVSSYGGWIDSTRGAWQGKSVQRVPDEGACDHPRSWSMAPLAPTPGW